MSMVTSQKSGQTLDVRLDITTIMRYILVVSGLFITNGAIQRFSAASNLQTEYFYGGNDYEQSI